MRQGLICEVVILFPGLDLGISARNRQFSNIRRESVDSPPAPILPSLLLSLRGCDLAHAPPEAAKTAFLFSITSVTGGIACNILSNTLLHVLLSKMHRRVITA